MGDIPFISSYGPHYGEERPLVGSRGSGTVFFSGCNLGCIFCQNWTISHGGEGQEISIEALGAMMMEIKDMGCHNLNLVSPTHQMPMILSALLSAAVRGFDLPIVYNTGGYDSMDALRLLDGIVDIYMPDIKYSSGEASGRYSDAPDYPEHNRAAIREMHRQVGDLVMDERGIAERGLLVRHLVLPGGLAGTAEAMRFIAGISKHTYVNIMDQYHPCYKAADHPPLNRRITSDEYEEAVDAANAAGLYRFAD